MGYTGARYDELRFLVKEDYTEVYVLITNMGQELLGVGGWHYKVYPKDIPVKAILERMFLSTAEGHTKDDSPLLWPTKMPPQTA